MVPQQAGQDVGTKAARRTLPQVGRALFALAVDAVADNAILGAEQFLATVRIPRKQASGGTNPDMAGGDYEQDA
jgi:hypothetical protein